MNIKNLEDVCKLIDLLRATSGKNAKLEILATVGDSELVRKTFLYALDPKRKFYLTTKKLVAQKQTSFGQTAMDMFSVLDTFAERKLTGGAAIEAAHALMARMTTREQSLFCAILDKDLRCGVDSSATKIWEDLVEREQPMMLCEKDTPKGIQNIKFPAYGQLKSDGMRTNIVVTASKIYAVSRNGKRINCIHPKMESELLRMLGKNGGKPFILDGELMARDPKTGSYMDRKTGNGIANKAVAKTGKPLGSIDDSQKSTFVLVVWDILPLDILEDGVDEVKVEYSKRLKNLMDLLSGCKYTAIDMIETSVVDNWAHARALAARYMKDGLEGAVIKNMHGFWENKRSRNCVKLKAQIQNEFLVIAEEEGEKNGKYAGKIGALRCRDASGFVEFSAGSGLSDKDRENDGYFIGKIVTIEYNAIIKSKNRQEVASLFLPTLVEVRLDKNKPDDLSAEVKALK